MMRPFRSRSTPILMLLAALAVGGCSTIQTARGGPGQRLDPWENWNRKVFAFNEGLDEKILKPVATGYAKAGSGLPCSTLLMADQPSAALA